MATPAPVDNEEFVAFVARTEPRLRQALIARYGSVRGREAVVGALHLAFRRWADIAGDAHPVPRLYRAGSDGLGHRRTTASFDSSSLPSLVAALAQMAWRTRLALVLVSGFGWSLDEVAALTATPADTVPSRVANGLAALATVPGVDLDHLCDELQAIVAAGTAPVTAEEAMVGPPKPQRADASQSSWGRDSAPGAAALGVAIWRWRPRVVLAATAMSVVALAIAVPRLSGGHRASPPPGPPGFFPAPSCPASLRPTCSASPAQAAVLLQTPVPSPTSLPAGVTLRSQVVSIGTSRSYARTWASPAGQATVQLTMIVGNGDYATVTAGSLRHYTLADGAVATGNVEGIVQATVEAPPSQPPVSLDCTSPAVPLSTGNVPAGNVPTSVVCTSVPATPTTGPSVVELPPELTGSLWWLHGGAFFELSETGLSSTPVLSFVNSLG